MPAFTQHKYIPDYDYSHSAWDRYAIKYATLLQPGTLYNLHKEVMYDFLDEQILPLFKNQPLRVLDLNCGTGNDFPYWLQKADTLVGTDGSAGMLNKAAETYAPYIQNGQLSLYRGLLEDMDAQSLGGMQFDIIYSITGGFSYIDDAEFTRSFGVLKQMLRPGGVMITAHLNTFCLSETVACMLKGRWHRSLLRLKKNIPNINDGTMYLRNKRMIHRLLQPVFTRLSYYPLVTLAPPYQSDASFAPRTLQRLRRIEGRITRNQWGLPLTDQVIVVSS